MKEIIIMPFKKRAKPDKNRTLLELIQELGIPLQSSCGGKGLCGKCKVVLEQSEIPPEPPSDREKETLGDLAKEDYRLACSLHLRGGGLVRIPGESLLQNQVILTSNTDYPYPVRMRPNVADFYLEIPAPVLGAVKADRERLLDALEKTYGIRAPHMDVFVLRSLPEVMYPDSKGVSAALWGGKEIIDVCKGRRKRLVGMAFDIGTTTVVGYLMDLESGNKMAVKASINPQVAFGDDVISRISYCSDNPDGIEKLQGEILRCVNALMEEASSDAGIVTGDILEFTAVGNTVMHHLFLGLDPKPLSMAPYPPVFQGAQDVKCRDLHVKGATSARIHFPPIKAGFVGSDTIACVLATGIYRSGIPTLLIDLGTNGEIVLGNKDRLLCCSTAAGPAFEGAHIHYGMRAADGAIERIKIDPSTLDVTLKTIGDKDPVGICGSGVISAVAEMIRAGIVLKRGNFNHDIRNPRMKGQEHINEYVLAWGSGKENGKDVSINHKDISELQMAKAAICAGVCVLMEELGLEPDEVKRVMLAGAVGNYADPDDVVTIDLVPELRRAKITGVGNAAGHGACLALLDKTKRKDARRIAAKMEYVELAVHRRFDALFVEKLYFTKARDFKTTP